MKPIAAPIVGGNDYIHDPCTNSRTGFLCAYERTGAAPWHFAIERAACGKVSILENSLSLNKGIELGSKIQN